MDVSNKSTKNKNYKYIFVCVDVYGRKGHDIPMKNKNTLNVIEAFKKFLLLCKPKKLRVIMDQKLCQKISLIFVNIIILTLIMSVLIIILIHMLGIDLVLLIDGYKHFGQKWRNT